jgi:hypothetical protein
MQVGKRALARYTVRGRNGARTMGHHEHPPEHKPDGLGRGVATAAVAGVLESSRSRPFRWIFNSCVRGALWLVKITAKKKPGEK